VHAWSTATSNKGVKSLRSQRSALDAKLHYYCIIQPQVLKGYNKIMMFSVTATYKVHVKGWKVTSPFSALGTRLQMHANCLNAVLEKIPYLPRPVKPTETGLGTV